ncbi:sigma-70 family RNA polymerase sigma factor [Schleiferilactobacillus perolens]|uniref:RNA polymerase sigma-70 region 2 domain-containing protein n=1 Tax=Schleiferilactobacillus perolens DSM 12744 TaxID=1423792 RepID=A0A0R1MWP1_9LACO|nr:sigma-70 family RNA polymerase sigma factor [Schleiferilactobacillus perolens]KRL12592.1 hypothetical protein FD09_GL002912 [Schleiferilactobacillus perolens DSM 12744]
MTNEERWQLGFKHAGVESRLIHGAIKRVGREFGIFDHDDLVQEAKIVFATDYVNTRPTTPAEWEQFRPRVFQHIIWALRDLQRREKWRADRWVDEASLVNAPIAVSGIGRALRQEALRLCQTERERLIVLRHWFADESLAVLARRTGYAERTLRLTRQRLQQRIVKSAQDINSITGER